ncbi:Cytoplasmic 60S subunit biogenesis factor REI1 homolog 1 [Linum perenne]
MTTKMTGLTCNSCNQDFQDDAQQKHHYKSDWHRYNLKRKVAGVPGVTEALFLARQSALALEKDKSNETPMLYTCVLCGKGYRSPKAHAQHVKSKSHIMKASQATKPEEEETRIRPLPQRVAEKPPQEEPADISEESEDEWVEVDPGEVDMNVDGTGASDDMDEDGDEDDDLFDPACCFMCDHENDSIEACMVHMHKQHGFFVPDVEYLKDPKGLLTYLGLKVMRDFMCLYCNDRRQPFNSTEAVRKHMEAKSHCKVHYGDGDDEEEVELEDFYDYSSSYVDEEGKQLVASGEEGSTLDLGGSGSELIITTRGDGKIASKTLGSREFLRYYRQKPRPPANDIGISATLAARYRSMGLATVQSKEQIVRMKVLKAMKQSGVEALRTKIGLKNNVIRNLPKNVPY